MKLMIPEDKKIKSKVKGRETFYRRHTVPVNPSNLKFVTEFLCTGITWNETKGDIYAQNGHSVVYLPWALLK